MNSEERIFSDFKFKLGTVTIPSVLENTFPKSSMFGFLKELNNEKAYKIVFVSVYKEICASRIIPIIVFQNHSNIKGVILRKIHINFIIVISNSVKPF